jgi:hypothetical protein
VLCSGKGGLKEAVGDERLIVESNSVGEYRESMREVFNNMDMFSEIAVTNATTKSASKEVLKLKQILERQVGTDLYQP